jgi:hypothetical protein
MLLALSPDDFLKILANVKRGFIFAKNNGNKI